MSLPSKYIQIKSQCLGVFGEQTHSIAVPPNSTLKGIILASTGMTKCDFYLTQNQSILTFFNSTASPTQQIDLNINLSSTSVVFLKLTNLDRLPCDSYITLLLEDNWAEYDRQFTQELEETLTT